MVRSINYNIEKMRTQVLFIAVMLACTMSANATFANRGICLISKAEAAMSPQGKALVYEMLTGSTELTTDLAELELTSRRRVLANLMSGRKLKKGKYGYGGSKYAYKARKYCDKYLEKGSSKYLEKFRKYAAKSGEDLTCGDDAPAPAPAARSYRGNSKYADKARKYCDKYLYKGKSKYLEKFRKYAAKSGMDLTCGDGPAPAARRGNPKYADKARKYCNKYLSKGKSKYLYKFRKYAAKSGMDLTCGNDPAPAPPAPAPTPAPPAPTPAPPAPAPGPAPAVPVTNTDTNTNTHTDTNTHTNTHTHTHTHTHTETSTEVVPGEESVEYTYEDLPDEVSYEVVYEDLPDEVTTTVEELPVEEGPTTEEYSEETYEDGRILSEDAASKVFNNMNQFSAADQALIAECQ